MNENPSEKRPRGVFRRDFNIRGEMRNFAQILKPEHDTRNPYRGL